jgi:hypothetical protein
VAHGLVEEAVLDEFDRLSERGDVLGAMESGSSMYQRGEDPGGDARIEHLRLRARSSKHCVQSCSLGQISRALYEVGGRYRRSM